MSDYIRRDPYAFEKVWKEIIWEWCQSHKDEPGVSLKDERVAKGRLMGAYNRLNEYCSDMYMNDSRPPLNQRKVAACFMYAIASTRPLTIDMNVAGCLETPNNDDGSERKGSIPFFANERLAISTACSIILSYLDYAVSDKKRCELSQGAREVAEARINGGIDLLEEVDHGEWLLNLEKALALTAVEGNINIPLMSCLVAYLESTVLDADTYAEVLKAFERVAREASERVAREASEGFTSSEPLAETSQTHREQLW